MAYITKRGDKWRAEVCIDRKRESKTFSLKRDAVLWAADKEQVGILSRRTLRQALEQYKKVAETHDGAQPELSRINTLIEKMECIDKPLDQLTPAMFAEYRDKRLKKVRPSSVRREFIILSAMFKLAVNEWGWISSSPLATVKKPTAPPARRRGISQDEIEKILSKLADMKAGPQVALMFRLSLETGMRLGELLSLKWSDVSEKSVTLQDSKNGDSRKVPLSPVARQIIAERRALGEKSVDVFTLSQQVASKTFQRARKKAKECDDVHFHDARSEAITRLSKKLDVLALARIIGHRDIKSLMFYYAESADDMADRL